MKSTYNQIRLVTAVFYFVVVLVFARSLRLAHGVYLLTRACMEMRGEFQRVRLADLPPRAGAAFLWLRWAGADEALGLRARDSHGVVWLENPRGIK